MTAVQTYLGSDKKAVDAILQFQRDDEYSKACCGRTQRRQGAG